MDFSKLIKEQRKEKGFTQKELANRARVSLRTVQRIETEPGAEISIYTLNKLATALDLDLSSMFSDPTQVDVYKESDIAVISLIVRMLNKDGRQKVIDYSRDIVLIGKYQDSEAIVGELLEEKDE